MTLKIKQVTCWYWHCDGPDCAVVVETKSAEMPQGWMDLMGDFISIDRSYNFHRQECKQAYLDKHFPSVVE